MGTESISIRDIKPYEKNAKAHPKEQIEKIVRSIQEFGFNQPLVLDSQYTIIVGHGRFEAAKQLNMQSVPCIIVDLPENKAKAYRLADNKLNESQWEMDIVLSEIKSLEEEGFDTALTGFDSLELKMFEESEEGQGKLDEYSEKNITCPKCQFQWKVKKNAVSD